MMVYVSSVCVSAMRRASYCVHSWEPPPISYLRHLYAVKEKNLEPSGAPWSPTQTVLCRV